MYKLVATTDKKTGVHARIIWCCNWTHDSKYFVTASRDGKVVMWGHSGSSTDSPLGPCSVASKPLELINQSVTAVAVAPITLGADMYLLAVGLETGSIVLYKWSPCAEESAVWQKCLEFDRISAHHLTVKKLAFRPLETGDKKVVVLDLASCGSDHTVKIFRIFLSNL